MDRQEAIQIIKNNWPTGRNMLSEALEYLIPELKESEDEKLKEQVVYAINQLHVCGCTKDKLLAWLEKQGEKTSDKIIEKARTEKQRILITETDDNVNINWDCRSLDDVKTLLKCGLEFICTIEADKQILPDNRFGRCSFSAPTRYDKFVKEGEQKLAAWSEEDERMCQETIDWFEKKCFPYALESQNPARESIKWLKSLKQRMKGE